MKNSTHRNRLLPRALLAVILPLGLQLVVRPVAGQTTEEIVAKVLAARGGLEKVKAVQAERITGTIYFSPDLYGPFIAEFKRPGKMHNEVTIHDKTVVRTINGKGAGWVINPFAGKDAPEAMSDDEIKDARNESDFDGPLVDSKAKGMTIEFAGTEKIEGKDTYVLKVTHKDSTISNYYFDAKTYLLARWSGSDNINGEAVTRETLFHDYRGVNGLKFAFELVSNNPGTEVSQRIVVEKIEVDPQIEETHFDKPAAPAAAPSAGEPPQK